jgi:hypothetical protein
MRTFGDYIDIDVLQVYYGVDLKSINPKRIFNEYDNFILKKYSKKTIEMLLINYNPQL